MAIRKSGCLALMTVIALASLRPGQVCAEGYVLGETKDRLKLQYDVSVQDHGTGRVTVVLTLADEGRLKPLDEVQLVIPAQERNADGSYCMDLVVSIDMTDAKDGKRTGRIHLIKALAERAQIHLNTHTLDGKFDPLTRYHHVIPMAEHLKSAKAAKTQRLNRSRIVASPEAQREFIPGAPR